ncbi:MAG: endonuclease/exonuclease/phosphatase family protein [Bacteroidales bacterium]|nr:endonuclease/exonuclease/phosphatase family protein [Bacteroidales bacterium]
MRKQFIHSVILLAIAGWVFGACTNQPLPGSEPADEPVIVEPETVDGMVLTATQPDGDATKTTLSSLGNQKYETLWKTGDQISINGTKSVAVASADNGKKSVDFTVNGTLSSPYNVLYPGTTSANVITLPATQSYVADSFDGTAAASYGVATLGANNKWSVKFHSFCGILRFALKGSATLSRIEVKSLGSEKLYGNFTISNFTTGAFTGGTAGTLTYNIGSVDLSAASDTYFYVAIPAQKYASGLEAVVYQSDGAFMTLKFWANDGSGYTLERDTVYEFGSKTYAAGRTENLFGVSDLAAESGSASLETRIIVGCYNLYAKSSRTKDYMDLDNSAVRDALGQAVADMGADIIGINEIDNNFKSDGTYSIQSLAEAKGLTGYTWCLAHPDDIQRDGWILNYTYSTGYKYADGFAYRTSMFSITDHDYVWISHTADNTYYDNREDAYGNSGGPETTCAYAKFTHTSSSQQFYVFVTHTSTTDHIGSEVGATQTDGKYDKEDAAIVARRLRIVNNVKYFCNQKAGSLPYIVMGDFNFGPYYDTKKTRADAAYSAFTGSGYTNAYDDALASDGLSGFYTTYPGTQTGSNWGASFLTNLIYPQFRIDHIWLKDGSSQNIKAETYRTVRRTYDVTTSEPVVDEETGEPTGEYESVTKSWCPSDHFPVVAQILFE